MAANGICLVVAGVIRATVPSSEFTLAWEHSVEKTRWEERYRVEGDRLALVEARVQALGAGMEPPPGAQLRDAWWTWRPALAPLPELRLASSRYATDYELCWNGRCTSLNELIKAPYTDRGVTIESCSTSIAQ